MAAIPDEKRELELVDKVDFKILAVANKEERLKDLLGKFLAPLLLKAESPHASVRNRVIEICKRLKTFIEPQGVSLPVEALVEQYKKTQSPILKALDMTFIQHSVGRIDEDARAAIIPKVIAGMAKGAGEGTAPSLFNVLLRLLPDLNIPSRGSVSDGTFRESVGLSNSEDAKYLANWFAKVILLKVQSQASSSARSMAALNPSLTASDLDFLRPDRPETNHVYSNMPAMRRRLVKLLASGAFEDSERFIPALIASGNSDSQVSSVGIEIVKRSDISLEDPILVKTLFELHERMAADVRIRILERLSRSEIATTMTDGIVSVVQTDFLPPSGIDPIQNPSVLLQPASALERTKLHKAVFQFLTWVGTIGPRKGDFTIGAKMVDIMMEYINSTGWPVPEKAPMSADEIWLRGKAYETIGLIAGGSQLSTTTLMQLVGFLFRALSEDPMTECVVNIDAALSSTAKLYNNETMGDELSIVRSLLLEYMDKGDESPIQRSARHMAVKWANQCLPLSDKTGRWIDILAVAGRRDERSDVVDEGRKGLDPWTYYAHSDANPVLPKWEDMASMFFASKIAPLRETMGPPGGADAMELDKDSIFVNFGGDRIMAFPAALEYCKKMMFLSALKDFKLEPDWMRRLEALIKTDNPSRAQIRRYLASVDAGYVVFMLKACLDGFLQEDVRIIEECGTAFVEIASLAPANAIGYLVGRAKDLLPLTRNNKSEIRLLAAKALGILAAHPTNEDVGQIVAQLSGAWGEWSTAVGAQLNIVEGAILAFAHVCSRAVYYGRKISLADVHFPQGALLKENTAQSLKDVIVDALAQLWTAGLLIPQESGEFNASNAIESLAKMAKKPNEKVISAIGRLAMGIQETSKDLAEDEMDTSDPWARGQVGSILTELFKLHEIKQAEVHFTVGEAITATIACWESEFVQLTLDVEAVGDGFKIAKRSDLIKSVLDKLFADSKQTKPSLLKASGIWLFCIVQYCSHLSEVQARLREAQVAFMRLLNARDELVQETASRGLSLVYEKGDESLKDELVRDLVSAFTGSGTQLKVEDDTELFEAGALPTGEGKSIVSYKDIVSLANEVGDPSLVYKFMSLATNAATWTKRSAFGRFGLGNLIGDKALDPKLYSKLYRFRFDPNTNVQRSMNDIWKAMVKDSNKVLDEHFDAIMEDLLKNLLGREWRVREATCSAIRELVQGRPFQKYEKYYHEIWTKALKVLDDVKGSVREAALKLCMGMSNTITRLLEESNNLSATQAMLKEALPFLLSEQGMESTVQDVKLFATMTVLSVAKKGGKAVKPFIPTMVPQLLGLLSTIEPEAINYHYQRLGEDNREKLDQARASMVNRSPISEAIDNCLRQVDAATMTTLAPRLEATIKGAIGMPTKIGCSRVLTTLFTRHQQDIVSFAPRFLKLMEKQMLDKNDSVSKSYAKAAAYMIRIASDASRDQFCAKLIDMYFTPEDGEFLRQKVADTVVAISHVSPDHFSALEARLLPFSYFGSHDTDEYTRTEFKAVWEQHAGSNRTVARFAPEIIALIQRALQTAQWALQHTAALTVAAMIPALASASDTSGQISDANLKLVWPVLDKSLSLKTFEGKEKLLDSFPEFVAKGKSLWATDSAIAAQLKKIAIREAKRNNDAYRVHAFNCLWKFAEAREDLDMLKEIADIVKPFLDDFKDDEKMELDSKNDTTTKIVSNGFEAVARGYQRSQMKSDSLAVLTAVLDILKPYLSSSKFAGIKREVWYKCATDLLDAAALQTKPDEGGIASTYLLSLDPDLADQGTEKQRMQRAKAIAALLKARFRGVFGQAPDEEAKQQMRDMLRQVLERERSLDVQKVLREILDELK